MLSYLVSSETLVVQYRYYPLTMDFNLHQAFNLTMWSAVSSLLALSSLTVSTSPLNRHCEENPVCIIGAGPAGLAAAGRLEQNGIKAVMFDRQEEVGGKCQAWYDEQ
jgi:NADPH-dependent 2,4-dienoyl-CoA reductase/sulfur reductase-like enzyme